MTEPSMKERIARTLYAKMAADPDFDDAPLTDDQRVSDDDDQSQEECFALADAVLAETHTEELLTALEAITDHFADVMDGPMIKGAGVVWPNGVEGIRTIKVAREAIRAARAGR